MRVLVLAPGSWGDVSPAIRIATGLIADGHAVTMVAHADYAAAVESAGCAVVPFTVPLTPPAHSTDGGAGGARVYMAHLREYMMDHARAAVRAVSDGTPSFGAVITNPISPYGHDIAEALGVPSAEALLQPAEPSRAYPPMIASALELGPLLNRPVGRLLRRAPAPVIPAVTWVRRELGLPPEKFHASRRRREAAGVPVHHGISPAVLPRPSDWPANLHLDGYWWPVDDPDWTPPADLVDFLATGPAPVLVTMGSVPEGSRTASALRDLVATTRHRAIIQGADGPSLAEEHPGRVLAAGSLPHSWLLPQVAAVVHQAGAGVTAACLRAGVPGVPLPQHTDQFFWARTAGRLGAAVPALTGKKATAEALVRAVDTATSDTGLRRGAAAVAERIARAESDEGDSTMPLRQWVASLDG